MTIEKLYQEIQQLKFDQRKILSFIEKDKSEWVDTKGAMLLIKVSNAYIITRLRVNGFFKDQWKQERGKFYYKRTQCEIIRDKIDRNFLLIKGTVIIPNE